VTNSDEPVFGARTAISEVVDKLYAAGKSREDTYNLLGAAPELLDACEYALFHIDVRLKDRMDLFTADERNVLRKAIAKAKGVG
jgi:hypothetical protein